MRMFAFRNVIVLCAVVAVTAAVTGAELADPKLQAYYDCLSSGRQAAAMEAGRVALEAIRSQPGKAEAVEQVEAKLQAFDDARALTVGKLEKIVASAEAKRPDPLLYILPQPAEVFRNAYMERRRKATPCRGLTQAEKDFVLSLVKTALLMADEDVVGEYLKVLSSGVDDFAKGKARAYMSAYMIGLHDETTYPAALRIIAEATGGQYPAFLAHDALDEIGSSWAAKEVLIVLERFDEGRFDREDRARILKMIAKVAEETEKDYAAALWAYQELAQEIDETVAENAHLSIIRIYTEWLKDYTNGSTECGRYLESFPSGSQAPKIRCLKALCRYRLDDYEGALSETREIENLHAGTGAEAYALLLRGMVYAKQGALGKAIDAYAEVEKRYPATDYAARALLLSGVTHLQYQEYDEAKECFQRIVDFHTDSPYVEQARQYIDKLGPVVEQSTQSEK